MKSSIYHKVKILREVKKHRLQETLESNKPAQQHHQEQQVPEHSKDDDQQQLMHGIQEQDNAPKYSQDLTTNVLTPNFTPFDKLRHVDSGQSSGGDRIYLLNPEARSPSSPTQKLTWKYGSMLEDI